MEGDPLSRFFSEVCTIPLLLVFVLSSGSKTSKRKLYYGLPLGSVSSYSPTNCLNRAILFTSGGWVDQMESRFGL